VILILSLSFHEYGHAWSANKLGDPTAKNLGRLTLNPIPHLHPIFTVALPLYFLFFTASSAIYFAAARPVPVDPRNLRSPVRDMTLTSIAGPAMNVVLALFFTAAYWFHLEVRHIDSAALSSICIMDAIRLNLLLAVFNMLPVPPLDGHRVLGFFLPARLRDAFYSFGQYGFLLLLVLMMRGTLDPVMSRIFSSVDRVWMNLMPGHMSIFGYGA
jgi:Zn-dependent protease